LEVVVTVSNTFHGFVEEELVKNVLIFGVIEMDSRDMVEEVLVEFPVV
jgi:hypothetical protein